MSYADITTAVTTAITSIGGAMGDMVEAVIPVALPIAGLLMVVSIGISVFRRFAR